MTDAFQHCHSGNTCEDCVIIGEKESTGPLFVNPGDEECIIVGEKALKRAAAQMENHWDEVTELVRRSGTFYSKKLQSA